MRIPGVVALIVLGGMAVGAHAKNKKNEAPPQFCQAKSVFVQTVNGDPQGPQVSPADRAAANALIADLGDWKRYEVVKDPSQADLIFVVKAGRSTAEGGNPGGNPGGGGGRPNPNAGMSQDGSGMSPTPGGGGQGGQVRGGMSNSVGGVPDEMSAASNGDPNGTNGSHGPANDILAIYQRPDGGPLTSPLWQRSQKGGLEAPKNALFEQVKTAVEASCGSTPAAAAQ
ncbi:MAG: hypothetical protein WA414_13875 [Acidobacteriaceae bacterium]